MTAGELRAGMVVRYGIQTWPTLAIVEKVERDPERVGCYWITANECISSDLSEVSTREGLERWDSAMRWGVGGIAFPPAEKTISVTDPSGNVLYGQGDGE